MTDSRPYKDLPSWELYAIIAADEMKQAKYQEWTLKSQETLRAVQRLLSKGNADAAMREIEDYWRKWGELDD